MPGPYMIGARPQPQPPFPGTSEASSSVVPQNPISPRPDPNADPMTDALMSGSPTIAERPQQPQTAVAAPQTSQQPDRLQQLEAMRADETKNLLDDINSKVRDQDGRLRSGIAGFFDQFNQSLRARLASGAPMGWGDFATLVGSGVGGFVGGGLIHPQWNEERERANVIGARQDRIKLIDDQIKVEGDAQTRQSSAELNRARTQQILSEPAKLEKAAALENLKVFPDDPNAQARATKAGWIVGKKTVAGRNVQTVFDPESGVQRERDPETGRWGRSLDETGQPFTTKEAPKVGKLPESFYALDGTDEKTIHADAVKRAGAGAFVSSAELDPAKIAMLKKAGENDDDAKLRIQNAIAAGLIPLHEVVKDSQKAEAARHDASIASIEGPNLQRLNLYKQAIDQTSPDSKAPLVSIAKFQAQYKEFWTDYQKLYRKDPKAAEAKREQFFSLISQYRLR